MKAKTTGKSRIDKDKPAVVQEARRSAKFPVVTGEQLELLLQVNRRTVQRYVKERGLPKVTRDRYDLREVWQWQIGQLTEEIARKNINAERLLAAQAEEREHKAAILSAKRASLEGRMVDRAIMEADLLDRALAVKKQMELMKDNLTDRVLRILSGLATGKKEKQKEGERTVLVREEIQAAVQECMTAFAKEPGEFDLLEGRAAAMLAEHIARKISPPEKQAAAQAAIVRIFSQQYPAFVSMVMKN